MKKMAVRERERRRRERGVQSRERSANETVTFGRKVVARLVREGKGRKRKRMKRRSRDRGKRKLKRRNQNQRLPSTQIPEVLSLFPSPPSFKLISCFSHPYHTRSYSLARYLSQRVSAASVYPGFVPRTRMGSMCGRRMVVISPNKPSRKWISSDPIASIHILHRAQH
jgi:hypothetical protein